tara:strand:- start:12710 stop:12949 length:240 start_codon:yes stop_codon:yes gene_type:complete
MNEEQIAEVWTLFKEYLDKKHIEMAAERYIDMLADYGVRDETLTECFGNCNVLDSAIKYYLDLDNEDVHDDEDSGEWDE